MGGGTDVAGKSSNKKKRSVAAGLGLGANLRVIDAFIEGLRN